MNDLLQDTLYSEIPLTRTIGIKVVDSSPLSLSLSAPLLPNINHKSTAFGGSLYSVSVLTGWGLIFQLLKQHDLTGHIVIQESQTRYLKPVTDSIVSICNINSHEIIDKFIHQYMRKGIARLSLDIKIANNNETCVLFSGRYVVHRENR